MKTVIGLSSLLHIERNTTIATNCYLTPTFCGLSQNCYPHSTSSNHMANSSTNGMQNYPLKQNRKLKIEYVKLMKLSSLSNLSTDVRIVRNSKFWAWFATPVSARHKLVSTKTATKLRCINSLRWLFWDYEETPDWATNDLNVIEK